MTSLPTLHPAYQETDMPDAANDRAVVVTLLGANIPAAYLEEAEPSPLMEAASRWWRRTLFAGRLALILMLLGGYPLMVALSHKIDSRPINNLSEASWSSPEIATALTLIAREETQAGWAVDKAWWRPQSRLAALPAWQEGLTSALSDYMLLTAQIATSNGAQPDADLMAAGRLLAPIPDLEAEPRMHAAVQALQRYDGRLSRSLAGLSNGDDALQKELSLFIAWADIAQHDLRLASESADGWPASRADIEAVYKARGQAHVAAELLQATFNADPSLTASRDISEGRRRAIQAWRKAANFSPLFVSSPGQTNGFLSDHPATMGWYMSEAKTATESLSAALSEQTKIEMNLIASLQP